MDDKRGLSTVITTLIIILLVLVATGIVWVVISNLITQGTGDIETGTGCLNVDLKATAVSCNATDTWNCTVSLYKKSGRDAVAGVKLIFDNGTDTTLAPIDVPGIIATLATKKKNVNTTISNANSVDVTVYFTDSSGNEKLCSQVSTFKFV